MGKGRGGDGEGMRGDERGWGGNGEGMGREWGGDERG